MKYLKLGVLVGILSVIGAAALAADVKPGVLALDPLAAKTEKLGYFPVRVEFLKAKPATIVKEPTYTGKVQYAAFALGNGPKSKYFLAVDEPETGPWRIYVDKNQNGDLSDDGDGAWSKEAKQGARIVYGVNEYTLRASWGTDKQEKSSGLYGVGIYRISNIPSIMMYRLAGRTGNVKIGDKLHKVLLVDNDADGMYSKPLGDDGKPVGGGTSARPVWMMIDLNDDGKFGQDETFDARSPFKIGDKAFEAEIASDGSKLQILPTKRVVADKPKEPESKPLLRAGVDAPNFKADAWGGGKLELAEYKGKVVILDFWSTWCGPCQRSMPHVEKVYKAVKDQGVEVIGLCVWDDKAEYDKWVPTNQSKYTFKFAFDPAGKGADNIAAKLYNVSGIPTTYIIGKDGKVIDSVVGYDDNDTRIETALKKAGINVGTLK